MIDLEALIEIATEVAVKSHRIKGSTDGCAILLPQKDIDDLLISIGGNLTPSFGIELNKIITPYGDIPIIKLPEVKE